VAEADAKAGDGTGTASVPETGPFERRLRALASVVAPTTAITAVLFYFGYVLARSQYEYFGVDVDTIGLGTRDYIMRSPQALLVPLLVLAVLGIGGLLLHARTLRRIAAASSGADTADGTPTPEAERLTRAARRARDAGLALLGIGFVLLFVYAQVRTWSAYDLVTPLLIVLGGTLAAYNSYVLKLLRPTAPAPATTPERAALVLLYAVIAAGIFWATATIAQWSGRGLAEYRAKSLDELPSVILDTKERLFLRSPGIEETVLPASEGQIFHYRYRNLRLLIEGHDRMFLVPAKWSASDSTSVVPLDGSVRVQFQFVNQRP
jgi:hypothetical protein